MSERALLASCLKSRSAFDAANQFLEKDELGEQGRIILEHIADYYDTDPATETTDPEIVRRSIERSMSNPKHKETFSAIVADLAAMEVSPANVVKDLLGVKREAAGSKLATALAAGQHPDEVVPLIEEYSRYAEGESLTGKEQSEVVQGMSVSELVRTSHHPDSLIKVWPAALNDRLDGGCLPGHHIVVFARPEAGKTLMVINMTAGFLYQGLKCLYIGNEDPVADTVLRTVSRLSSKTKYEVIDNPEEADGLARERGYDNLVLASLTPGTPREIEALIREHEPDVVIVDQLRNLNVGESNFVQMLEKAAIAVRTLGKKYNCLMVSVTQAGDSASGKAILEMGDVDSSNTGIPATADVMIAVGGTDEDFMRDRRVISLPKNKRGGRKEPFPVQLIPQLSKIRGVE